MIQELFKGAIGPVGAGGFVGLLSLFNMVDAFSGRPLPTLSAENRHILFSSRRDRFSTTYC
jgi:hypothetical protein